jgi:hypothetical protein
LKEQLSVEHAVNFISYDSAAHLTQFGLSGFSQFCQFPRVSLFRAQGFFCLAALPLLLVTSANHTAVILAHWLIAVVVTVHLRPSFDRRECCPIWAMECWWKFHSNSSLSSCKVTSLFFTVFYISKGQIKLNRPTFSQFYEFKERSKQLPLDFGL